MDYLKTLNRDQQEAVTATEGPLLVLAGAGSGKTRVITFRILHLIKTRHVPMNNILGVTFTNKAANEMKERIKVLLNKKPKGLMISTFHAFGVKILRGHISLLGYKNNFNIYDENDRKNMIKSILTEMHLDSMEFNLNIILKQISMAKNSHLYLKYFDALENQEYKLITRDIYKRYEQSMKNYNAVDFDDLIILPLKILKEFPEVRKKFHQQYKYILVDEYQDTNNIQYELLKLLINKNRNLCVVGDDDQAIYGFRGSKVEHILRFEKDFPGTRIIKLSKNYRSTATILTAANEVIKNNDQRHAKTIESTKPAGNKIIIKETSDETREAEYVVSKLSEIHHHNKVPWNEIAILYRTNFQSRPFEEALRFKNISYKLVGGMQFYDRKEIKDILSYLKVIANEKDELSLLRIINYPKRSIGDKTIYELNQYSMKNNTSLYQTISDPDKIDKLTNNARSSLTAFIELIEKYKKEFFHTKRPMYKIAHDLVKEIRLEEALKEENNEALAVKRKMFNISELISSIRIYEEEAKELAEKPNLYNYLNKISLLTKEEDNKEENNNVFLMSLHSSKGLEFNTVFLVGIENDFLPHLKTIEEGGQAEEERRLFYVGITRTKENLIITHSKSRKRFGLPEPKEPSPFLLEIPRDLILTEDEKVNELKNNEISKNAIARIKEMVKQ